MKMNTLLQALGFVVMTGVAAPVFAQNTIPLASADCAPLKGFSIPPSAIDLPPAVVQSAIAVAASETGNAKCDFCKVIGIVKPKNPGSPNLEFEVNLPFAWNIRALQMGGGG